MDAEGECVYVGTWYFFEVLEQGSDGFDDG